MNARKHGIFAAALTEQDAHDLHGLLEELIDELQPAGIVEELLVDKLAVTYLRMQRCAQAERTHYLADWNCSFRQPGQFRYNETVAAIGLYDARLTKQFLRLLNQLAWRQKARAEEASKNADASFAAHRATPALRSSAASAGEEESQGEEGCVAQLARRHGRRLVRRSFSEGGSFSEGRSSGAAKSGTSRSGCEGWTQNAERDSRPQQVGRASAAEMQNEPNSGEESPPTEGESARPAVALPGLPAGTSGHTQLIS